MARFNLRTGTALSAKKKIESFVHKQIREAWEPTFPIIVGKTYIFRTITMYDIGTVTSIVGNFVMIDNAVWIPNTGAWGECLINPKEIESVEAFPKEVGINVNSIVDFTEWTLAIPKPKKKKEKKEENE